MADSPDGRTQNRYEALIEKIFLDRYRKGATSIPFERGDIVAAATTLKIEIPKNVGDVVYSLRYRTSMPEKVVATQSKGMEWIIEGAGRARYTFKLVRVNRIAPNAGLVSIKIPDATPEIISAYALSDEQALLAKVRYNRLVDVFLGVAAYSLQNHLRTSVKGIGQIEIDELYVGVDRHGGQFVMPVQAKAGKDKLSSVQAKQDIAYCDQEFPGLVCRPLSAQFMVGDLIAMFELVMERGEIKIVDEKHYRLVPADEITAEDLIEYSKRR
jgi:hypothetical protein